MSSLHLAKVSPKCGLVLKAPTRKVEEARWCTCGAASILENAAPLSFCACFKEARDKSRATCPSAAPPARWMRAASAPESLSSFFCSGVRFLYSMDSDRNTARHIWRHLFETKARQAPPPPRCVFFACGPSICRFKRRRITRRTCSRPPARHRASFSRRLTLPSISGADKAPKSGFAVWAEELTKCLRIVAISDSSFGVLLKADMATMANSH